MIKPGLRSMRSKMGFMMGLAASSAAFTAASALADRPSAWDSVNAPNRLENGFTPYFDETGTRAGYPPLESHVPLSAMPYADTYWPANRGGIAYRWSASAPMYQWRDPYLVDMALRYRIQLPNSSQLASMNEDAREIIRQLEALSGAERAQIASDAEAIFTYQSPSKAYLLSLTPDAQRAVVSQLSPTEKYDLARGQYTYPMTNSVLHGHGLFTASKVGPHRAYWEGICHGWAPASVNYAEPLPNEVRNSDGVIIPFHSADVKAILDYMYASTDPHVRQMGRRCNVDLDQFPNSTDGACADVNAGAFHIVMSNYIGLQHRPFVADVSRGREVWNNPIYAYTSQVVGHSGPVAGSAAGTTHRVRLKTTIRYASDDERLPPQRQATTMLPEKLIPDNHDALVAADYENVYRYEEAHYDYWLELDGANRILGGEWVPQYDERGRLIVEDRPDYVWMKGRIPFSGEFEALNVIYRPIQVNR